jgi:hypothetical protein
MFENVSFSRAALKHSLLRSFVVGNWRVGALLALALLGVALVGGAAVALVHPVLAVALPLAIGAGLLALRTPQWGLYGTVAIAILLPFAALPVSIGFKPTFLDVALGGTFFVWFMSLMGGRTERIRVAGMSVWVLVFLVVAVAAFVMGLGHAPLDRQTVRRFAELILALLLFFIVVDHVRERRHLEGLAAVIMLGGFASAALGIVLYFLPHDVSNALLNRLTVFDYPGGWVLRFILDDPTNNQRAISTSVDPNVFGGMLIMLTAVTAPQIAAARPLFPRRLTLVMTGTMVLALALTFSRGSMLGLVVALTPLVLLRYRRLIPWAIGAALLLLLLPQAQDYIGHFIEGLRGRDLATQMRFGEYKDALTLIRRYPWFGVGFTAPPDIDLYIGVSSVYLLIAEQMGLIGLSLYLVLNGAFFVTMARVIRRLNARVEPLVLGLTSAILGALFAGIFDHHFFDVEFPHFATLYWLMMGLAVAGARIGTEPADAEDDSERGPAWNPLPLILDGAASASDSVKSPGLK